MLRCNKCNKKISKKQLNKVFQLTLGKTKNGNFRGYKKLYFHIEELVIPNSIK